MQCIMSIDAIKRNILFLSAIAIVLIGFFSYNSYHERNVRKYSEQFLEYSFKYCIISSIIGERECAVCNRCVMNKLYFNTKTGETYSEDECTRSMVNDLIYCSSKNEMLNQQAFFYTGMGVMDLLEDYKKKMDDAFERLSFELEKKQKIFAEFESTYNNANDLNQLVNNPIINQYGNIIDYENSLEFANREASHNYRYFYQNGKEICPQFCENYTEYEKSAKNEYFKLTGRQDDRNSAFYVF